MPLPLTALFIGLSAFLQIILTFRVVLRRQAVGVAFLDGGDPVLTWRIRAHGNFTEVMPMALLAMAAAELGGLPDWVLALGGTVLLAGRVIHAINLSRNGPLRLRVLGMLMTLLPLAFFAGCALVAALRTLA